jgi:hypothetical protein
MTLISTCSSRTGLAMNPLVLGSGSYLCAREEERVVEAGEGAGVVRAEEAAFQPRDPGESDAGDGESAQGWAEAGRRGSWRGHERGACDEGVLLLRKRASAGVVGGRPPEPPLRPARSQRVLDRSWALSLMYSAAQHVLGRTTCAPLMCSAAQHVLGCAGAAGRTGGPTSPPPTPSNLPARCCCVARGPPPPPFHARGS